MNRWLDEYRIVAHRTRWIGLIGAAAILALIVLELSAIYIGVSVAEVPFQGDFADTVMRQVWLLVLVGLSFAARAFLLLTIKREHYSWIAISWLFSFVVIVLYLWEMSPGYSPVTPVCGDDARCFGIYDIRREDRAALGGKGFIIFSVVRALFTAAYAGLKYRYR